MSNFIIRDVEIFDGTGLPPKRGDISVCDGLISEVGTVTSSASEVIDGSSLAVAPGFIDVHTHDDFAVIVHPSMDFKLRGGVTTCIVGNCGSGAAPWNEAREDAAALHPYDVLPQWNGYDGYLKYLDVNPAGVNVAALVGLGTARQAAMGASEEAPSSNQLSLMKDIVEEGLGAGAVGVSSGLVYDPGRFSTTDELVELASMMRGTTRVYTSHIRDEGSGLLGAVAEAISIGERAGVAVQISHHKAAGRGAWGLVSGSLRLIEEAQKRGLNVHADQYPYTVASTYLSAIFRDGEFGGKGFGTILPSEIMLSTYPPEKDLEGLSISDIAKMKGVEPAQAATQILAAVPKATAVFHLMHERDVLQVMGHPSTMIGSDGVPTLHGKPHPRLYDSFVRVLGRYARDAGVFSMAEAVYRMTGFPATKFGLRGRGYLKPGFKADLVLFDPRKVIDRGTFENPDVLPEGIDRVFVNGALAIKDGAPTGSRAGHVLRAVA